MIAAGAAAARQQIRRRDVFAAVAAPARGAAAAENATPSRPLQLYATALRYEMQTLRLLMAEVQRRVMGWRRARMAPHICC